VGIILSGSLKNHNTNNVNEYPKAPNNEEINCKANEMIKKIK